MISRNQHKVQSSSSQPHHGSFLAMPSTAQQRQGQKLSFSGAFRRGSVANVAIPRFNLPDVKRQVGTRRPAGKILELEADTSDEIVSSASSSSDFVPSEQEDKKAGFVNLPISAVLRKQVGQPEKAQHNDTKASSKSKEGSKLHSSSISFTDRRGSILFNPAPLSSLLLARPFSEQEYQIEIAHLREYLSKSRIFCCRFKKSKKDGLVTIQSYLKLSKDYSQLEFVTRTKASSDPEALYTLRKSSASCKVCDIDKFIYCGQSPVFDTVRKFLLAFPHSKSNYAPFESWNCLTLRTKDRDIDLMIKKESHLRALIKFLIYSLKSMDGTPGTFTKVSKNFASAKAKKNTNIRRPRKSSKQFLPPLRALKKLEEAQKYRLACRRFYMQTVQAKLSFMAYSKNLTVKELFYGAIYRTYEKFYPEETDHFLYELPALNHQSKAVDLDSIKKMIMKAINDYAIRGDIPEQLNRKKRSQHHHMQKKKFDLNKLKELDSIIDSLSDSNLAYQVYFNEHQQRRTYQESKYSLHRALQKQIVRLLFLNLVCGIELVQVKLQRMAIQRELDLSEAEKLAAWLTMSKNVESENQTLFFYDLIESSCFQSKFLKQAFSVLDPENEAFMIEPSPGREVVVK